MLNYPYDTFDNVLKTIDYHLITSSVTRRVYLLISSNVLSQNWAFQLLLRAGNVNGLLPGNC